MAADVFARKRLREVVLFSCEDGISSDSFGLLFHVASDVYSF